MSISSTGHFKEENMKKIFIIVITVVLASGIFQGVFAKENSHKTTRIEKITETKNKFDYINMDWWTNFNDEYLLNYIERAVNYNHNLKIATISTKEYYQTVKIQLGNELPSISAGFAPAYVKMPYTSSSGGFFALPILANYEIDIFLKNRDKTKSVKKMYEMSLIDERSAYISTVSAIGTTYLNILKMDKLIEIQKEIVRERQTIFDLMSKRNQAGITSTADTMRANKAYISAVTDLTELEKQRDLMLNMFSTLIGESSENSSDIERKSYDEVNFTGDIPEYISTEVIENRPDYIKSLKLVEKSGIDVRIAKKEFLPSFNIGGLALFNASELGKLLTTKNALTAIGGIAGIELFTGGRKIANLKLKKANYEKAIELYEQTNLTAIQEINDSLLKIKKDREKLKNTYEQEKLEIQDNNYYKKRFENGIISKLDLAQSNENLLTIKKRIVNQTIDCLIDYIGLYKTTGAEINK